MFMIYNAEVLAGVFHRVHPFTGSDQLYKFLLSQAEFQCTNIRRKFFFYSGHKQDEIPQQIVIVYITVMYSVPFIWIKSTGVQNLYVSDLKIIGQNTRIDCGANDTA